MIPYIILFITLLWCGFWEINNISISNESEAIHKTSSKRMYVILPFAIIIFLGIFRETSVGYDSETYQLYYWLQVDSYSWMELLTDFSIDNGFFLVLKAIALFTDDWWAARAILFVFTFILYYIAIQKESPYQSVSLLIFIGLANLGLLFSILRQALAGAICLFAYQEIQKKSWIKCLVLILIAATIHKAALVSVFLLLVYFIRVMRAKKNSGYKLFVISVLSYLVFLIAIPLITDLYADARYEKIAQSNGGYGMLLFIIVILTFSSYLMKIANIYNDDNINYMFNISCGALFIQVGALQWDLLNRAGAFFTIYWCMLLPKLLCCLSQRKRLKYYLILAILFGFMFFYQLAEVEMFIIHQF